MTERSSIGLTSGTGRATPMANCFELVVNFGADIEAARTAALKDPVPFVLCAGVHRIPLHRPMLRTVERHVELSILPVAVASGSLADGSLPRFQLTAAELTEIAHQLYRMLAGFDGYVAARVGWDPEDFVDLEELRTEWAEELRDGTIPGLVLSDHLHAAFGLGAGYVEFAPGYRWIPYRYEGPGGPSTH
ncbi:hypothetical protein [Streptomyces sp. NPDC049040]|uniref:hypothetical protein n=1 Tax=Streptomyces sp. NPDC049040 TaxID=3365593 RepID=UPI00371347D7